MKKISFLITAILLLSLFRVGYAQQVEDESYTFEIKKQIKTTPVRDQYRSGTCWSFSANAFIETELLRMGKPEVDISEMWMVRHAYQDKAEKYVRVHGSLNFGGGGAFHDVFDTWRKYGVVPEEAYPGLNYGEEKHVHGELDGVLKKFVDGVIENGNKKLSTAWKEAFMGILDAYFGVMPESFTYQGKKYTPKEFADNIGFKPDDYVDITSYTHHPFYKAFILEIPDNWAWGSAQNLPLDEMMQVIDNALNNGYPVCWGADVSEKGFSWSKGIAIVPADTRPDLDGLERDKWEKLSDKEKNEKLYSFSEILPEMEITQELRQAAFDNYQTTDDHGMVFTGIAFDQKGNKYYLVKNSWNTNNIYEGYFYASEAYVRYKTMNIVVHKDAVPKDIRKKLDI
ncbi:MAG: aminopeptidase [Bacteroidales bacterium]|mgnify:CR=1 FL=1|nr:aminopeptidase [Bacteroidales bacterium]HOY39373.1 C1 family peptidase [Bacteroidales bacterium]HQP04904.1 C1 family peptidase [Bacteroidales bacterium]